jgi:LAS superfamily LD-carboxypeptidase LdcB
MKRLFIIFVSVCMLSTAAYGTFFTHSHASNNPETEEYYYNKEEWERVVGVTDSSGLIDQNVKLAAVDTKADSITVLINKELALPSDYIPENLIVPQVLFSFTGYTEKKLLRKEAAEALEELFLGAADKGLTLCAVSGYRSYARQKAIYNNNVTKNGSERTEQFSAKPGCSEHQSGLAMDVSTKSVKYSLDESFADTPEGKFLEEEAYQYGFILRYPKDKSEITGYAYEPWHIRYVGKTMAQLLHDSGKTLEEYYGYTITEELKEENSYGTAIDIEEIAKTY